MHKMSLTQTALFFGIPGLVIFLSYMFLLPILLSKGLILFWAVYICTLSILIIMASLVLYRCKSSGSPFKSFFWFKKLTKKEWLLILLAFVAVQVFESLLSPTSTMLSQYAFFQAPDFFPDLFKPGFEVAIPLKQFLGISLKGNPSILWLWLLWLVTNIGCEELLWRGYALPRMEKTFGKWAWLVNGLLWNIVIHFFMRWTFIALIPVSLVVPYLSQKTKSMWPGIIIHGLGNALVYVILIPSVLAN